MAQVVECLPRKCAALSSNTSTKKKKKEKKTNYWRKVNYLQVYCQEGCKSQVVILQCILIYAVLLKIICIYVCENKNICFKTTSI
jgi:hypothetical protein